jgi:hypothetical protein
VPVLMYANNEGIDHLESAIMGSGESVYIRLHTPARPPANESDCSKRCRNRRHPADRARVLQIAGPIENTSVVNPRNSTRSVRQLWPDPDHSKRDQGARHGFGPGAALSSRPVGDSSGPHLSSLFLAQINHEPALCNRARRDACCHSI